MGPTSKRPVASHLSIVGCESQTYSGVVLPERGGQMVKRGSWKEKLRVERRNDKSLQGVERRSKT